MIDEDASQRWQRVERALDHVLDGELAGEAPREALILAACGQDSGLADEVRRLLQADSDCGDFMQSVERPSSTIIDHQLAPGAQIGAWRVLRVLGRGGMGAVYLAERTDAGFTQKVAIKLLLPAAQQHLDRFLRERQILADLKHSGLARLVDGGVDDQGRPFMAMEYVQGELLLHWCTLTRATVATRLRLFLALCDVVSYAHRRLIVHRDIKPGNVLVSEDGKPRLLDFGIATLAREAVGDGQLTQALVTPNYAAPEQFAGRAVTTATDIHGLGATLYALLSGRAPWQLDGASLPVVVDTLLNKDPKPPSEVTATARGGLPASTMRGDLDAICMRALRKDPSARYESAEALASDLRRYLCQEPVHARHGNRAYKLRKFLRRNLATVTASALGICIVLTATAGAFWSAHQAKLERDMAQRDAARLSTIRNSVLHLFRTATEGDGKSQSTRDLLAQSAQNIKQDFGDDPASAAALLQMLGQLYFAMDDYASARPLMEQAIELEPLGAHQDVVADARYDLSQLLYFSGEAAAARPHYLAAVATWQADPGRYQTELIWSASQAARFARIDGKGDEAVRIMEASASRAEAFWGIDHHETATVLVNLAATYFFNSDPVAALEASGRAIQAWRGSGREGSAEALIAFGNHGAMALRLGRLDVAKGTLERAVNLSQQLYGESAALSSHLYSLGQVHLEIGQADQAMKMLHRAQQMRAQFGAVGDGLHVKISCTMAAALLQAGDTAGAEDELRAALGALRPDAAVKGEAAYCRALLAQALIRNGHTSDALAYLDQAETQLRDVGQSGLLWLSSTLAIRSALLDSMGQSGTTELREAIRLQIAARHADHYRVQWLRIQLSRLLAAGGQTEQAKQLADSAQRQLRLRFGDTHPVTRRGEQLRDSGVVY